MPFIVAFGHKARQGKDSAAAAILERFPGGCRAAFADALKCEITALTGAFGSPEKLFSIVSHVWSENIPQWVVYDPSAPANDPLLPFGKHRSLLQWWGEFRRSQNPNYWIERVEDQIKAASPKYVLITDLRYQNELNWVKSKGGLAVVVEREEEITIDGNALHRSEVELTEGQFDHSLKAASLSELKDKAIRLFRQIAPTSILP